MQNNIIDLFIRGVIMTQELFWTVSVINFFVIAVVTVINIVIAYRTAKETRILSKKIGIDMTMYREFMNLLFEFINSFSEGKVLYALEKENEDRLSIEIHNNYMGFKNAYTKLDLYIDYCYTDNRAFRESLKKVYNKYCTVFDSLYNGVLQSELRRKTKNAPKTQEARAFSSVEHFKKYNTFLEDRKTDEIFFEQTKKFLKSETDYIKGYKI